MKPKLFKPTEKETKEAATRLVKQPNATLGNIPIYLTDDQIEKVRNLQRIIKQNQTKQP